MEAGALPSSECLPPNRALPSANRSSFIELGLAFFKIHSTKTPVARACVADSCQRTVVEAEITDFFNQCKIRGIELKCKSFSFHIRPLTHISHYGYSLTDTLSNVSVAFDKGFVKRAMKRGDSNAIKFLVFHELGHGLLKRKHDRTSINIMNDRMFSEKHSFKKYNSELLVNQFFNAEIN